MRRSDCTGSAHLGLSDSILSRDRTLTGTPSGAVGGACANITNVTEGVLANEFEALR